MPAVSEKQRRFMAKAATDAKFAKDQGIPQATAKEFMKKESGAKRPKKSQSDQAKTRYKNA